MACHRLHKYQTCSLFILGYEDSWAFLFYTRMPILTFRIAHLTLSLLSRSCISNTSSAHMIFLYICLSIISYNLPYLYLSLFLSLGIIQVSMNNYSCLYGSSTVLHQANYWENPSIFCMFNTAQKNFARQQRIYTSST